MLSTRVAASTIRARRSNPIEERNSGEKSKRSMTISSSEQHGLRHPPDRPGASLCRAAPTSATARPLDNRREPQGQGSFWHSVAESADFRPALRPDLLHDVEDRPAARHAVAPDPVEIGDERGDLVGSGRRFGRLYRVELVERDMHRRDRCGSSSARRGAPRRRAMPRADGPFRTSGRSARARRRAPRPAPRR